MVSVLLFSFVTNTLPLILASSGCDRTGRTMSARAASASRLLPRPMALPAKARRAGGAALPDLTSGANRDALEVLKAAATLYSKANSVEFSRGDWQRK